MKKLSFLEAAYKILKRENKPLTSEEITKIALRYKLIETSGKTPERTMGAQIYMDIKRKGNKSRFVKIEKGIFGLKEWKSLPQKEKIIKDSSITKDIIKRLQDTQIKSTTPTEFEEALKEAFEFLGFEAELIGGSGDTDVLLTANIGQESYKVNVDGKTSKSGKIIDRQIDWLSLRDHKEKNNADFIVVVGPKFSGGNLEQRAKEYNVSLLTTEDLVKILEAHSKFPLTLLEIKDLFTYSGDLSARIEDVLTQNYSRRNLLEQFRIIIEEMESIQDRLGYFNFDSLAGREKIGELEVIPEDIDYIIKLLKLPFVNGIKELEQKKYILTMKVKDIAHIFNQISELLVKEKPITEPTKVIPPTEIKTREKLGSKYFKWYIKRHSIVAVARQEKPYEHYCPLEHFKTIFEIIMKSFNENNVINTDLIFSKLEGKELTPNRMFKGKPEEYKIRMVLGILEIEGLIKWTGSKRPIEFKLNTSLENIKKWFEKTFRFKS
jgi:DNA-directed RNA polymerase delta subunit